MPLPDFDNHRAVWVEKTKASHSHGGQGWEFGTCLWSPTTDKKGKRIYANMVAAEPEDLVLHFYEDAPFGRELDYYFCGISIINHRAEVLSQEPPSPGDWAGRPQYYRIGLKDFVPLKEPIALYDFSKKYGARIVQILKTFPGQPFVEYRGSARLAQGKYLSKCSPELYAILSNAIAESVETKIQTEDPTKTQQGKPRAFDYEGYVEGQRAKREASFFARNPRLVEDAKIHHGYRCQACAFQYDEMYEDIGSNFIEVHHLNPLSERRNSDNSARLTTLSQVSVLCANCHRMIHRLIRKSGRSISIAEFQKVIRKR